MCLLCIITETTAATNYCAQDSVWHCMALHHLWHNTNKQRQLWIVI